LPPWRTCSLYHSVLPSRLEPNRNFRKSDGEDHWAIIASPIETAKLNDVDPQNWLADTLTRLAVGHLANAIEALIPWPPAAT
jgi:hypothetical protein